MKGDFARVSFDPALHYSQVFQQQGRVLLEADWNEQAGIQLDLLRTLARDLIGPCWAVGDGFTLTPHPQLVDWELSPGHFYVDGILCVNEAPCTLATQPFQPLPAAAADGVDFTHPSKRFGLWLDVWERHLSALEAPGILDAALDGIETTSRAQVVWQLRLLGLDQGQPDAQLDEVHAALDTRLQAATTDADKATAKQQLAALEKLRAGFDRAGANDDPCARLGGLLDARAVYAWPRLRAQLGPADVEQDPCIIAADARYRGCENQLYRVEIHQGGLASSTATPTATSFKWSRENGSVIFPVKAAAATAAADGSAQLAVTLGHLGRDRRLGLAVNDWVELIDDDYTLGQRVAPLLQVIAIDVASRLATLAVPANITSYPLSNDARQHRLLRRWDQREELNGQGTVPLFEGVFVDLEDGIQIRFEPGGLYATGDYWLIPARVAGNGSLDWPQLAGAPAALESRGMHHHAVLGMSAADGAFQPCCCRFDSLCALLKRAPGDTRNVHAPPPARSPATTRTTRRSPARKTVPSREEGGQPD